MCLPLPALAPAAMAALSAASAPAIIGGASAALGIGSSIMGFIGQQQASKANAQAANLNYNMKLEQTNKENAQLSAQQTETNLTTAVQHAQDQGRIAASASGFGASSSTQFFNNASVAFNRTLGINTANYDAKRSNLQTENIGASIERSSKIASMPMPSFGALALNIAGNAIGGLTTYGALGGRFGVQPQGGH